MKVRREREARGTALDCTFCRSLREAQVKQNGVTLGELERAQAGLCAGLLRPRIVHLLTLLYLRRGSPGLVLSSE